ncbi:MAG TPA: hypothetical protein VH518_07490 [Tepidisphaeraceae bacterium]
MAEVQAERETRERKVRQAKARSKRRPKCKCPAYPWPHRPGGGLCRWPDPPLETWKGKAGANKPQGFRYRGVVKIICQQYGLHPVKDRERIERLMPWLYPAWCKRYWPLRLGFLRWHDMVDERDRLRIGAKPDRSKIPADRVKLKQWQALGLKSYQELERERLREWYRTGYI